MISHNCNCSSNVLCNHVKAARLGAHVLTYFKQSEMPSWMKVRGMYKLPERLFGDQVRLQQLEFARGRLLAEVPQFLDEGRTVFVSHQVEKKKKKSLERQAKKEEREVEAERRKEEAKQKRKRATGKRKLEEETEEKKSRGKRRK